MNFFEHQDKARFKTRKLIFLFLLSVILTAACVGVLFAYFSTDPDLRVGDYPISYKFKHFDWQTFGTTFLIVVILIFLITLFKKSSLNNGGKVIAQQLGGKLILEDTKNFHEKQLLNIIEEISIASGVPRPPVYLIEEKGINAFAAGFTINDAVIGVTRGALEKLNREELQGVIAHEFSHIFNGDMRINLKLISVLAGIMGIGLVGRFLLYNIRVPNNKENAGGMFFGVIMGLGLIIIGAIGTLFGILIKASISRQREYLADASAVQFTRNPNGIASALKKIGAYSFGSKISNPHAPEFSHMFFATSLSSFFNLTATHPPLKDRILAIDPNWNGEFGDINIDNNEEIAKDIGPWGGNYESANVSAAENQESKKKRAVSMASAVGVMMQNIGTISQESINNAQELINKIPQNIREEAANPFGALAIIYSLIIDENSGSGKKELEILEKNCDEAIFSLTSKLQEQISQMDKKFRLSLIDLTIPTLKKLSNLQYENFKRTVKLLIEADSKTNLFEWSLLKILFNSLDREFDKNYSEKKASYNLQEVQKEVAIFLSLMAFAGNEETQAREVFNKTILNQNLSEISYHSAATINENDLNKSIVKLEKLYPEAKEKLLKLCVSCLLENGIEFAEVELLRAFASILHCPMPLIIKSN